MQSLAKLVSDTTQSTSVLAAALKAVGNPAVDLLTSVIPDSVSIFALRATQLLDDFALVAVGNGSTVAGHAVSVCIEGVVPDAFCAELGSADLAVLEALTGTGGSISEELELTAGEGQQQADKKELGHHF